MMTRAEQDVFEHGEIGEPFAANIYAEAMTAAGAGTCEAWGKHQDDTAHAKYQCPALKATHDARQAAALALAAESQKDRKLLATFANGPRIWDAADLFATVCRLESAGFVQFVGNGPLAKITETGRAALECTCHREAGSHERCCGRPDGYDPRCLAHS